MNVILLTVPLSLVLVAIFVVFFLGERRRERFGGWESAALRPLDDETPRPAGKTTGPRVDDAARADRS